MIVSKTKKGKLRQTVKWLVPAQATKWKNLDSHPEIDILSALYFLMDGLMEHDILVFTILFPVQKQKIKHAQHNPVKNIAKTMAIHMINQ